MLEVKNSQIIKSMENQTVEFHWLAFSLISLFLEVHQYKHLYTGFKIVTVNCQKITSIFPELPGLLDHRTGELGKMEV